MEKSESIVNLAKALSEFHKSVGKVKKSETNPFFKSKYADLSAILDVIEEPLNNNGLSIVQLPKGINQLETILLHESGEYISETYTVTPVKNDPQSLGSSITYQRRYALGSILSLNIDKDDDGNEASKQDDKNNSKEFLAKELDLISKCESEEQLIKLWSTKTNMQTVQEWKSEWIKKRQLFFGITKKMLDGCHSIENLEFIFETLPNDHKTKFTEYKEELKLKLTPKQ